MALLPFVLFACLVLSCSPSVPLCEISRSRDRRTVTMKARLVLVSCLSCAAVAFAQPVSGPPLEGTQPLTIEGDIAAQMVAGIDKFLLREIDLSVERREKYWIRDFSSP